MALRVGCELVPEIRGNFKSKYRRQGGEEALLCPDCGQIQTEGLCLVCKQWEGIRTGLDLIQIKDLVTFQGEKKVRNGFT